MHQYVLTQSFFSPPMLMSSPFRHNKGRQTSDEPKTLKKSALSPPLCGPNIYAAALNHYIMRPVLAPY